MVSLAMQILGGHEMIHIYFEVQKSHQDFVYRGFFNGVFFQSYNVGPPSDVNVGL